MPKEKESYRDNLERLDKAFPDTEMLTATEVSGFLGLHRQTVVKWFSFNVHKRISKCTLAREMS